MDESKAITCIKKNLLPMRYVLGLHKWEITTEVAPLGGDRGSVGLSPSHRTAHIVLDPEAAKDENELLESMRHELFHVVLAEFDILHKPLKKILTEEEYQLIAATLDHCHEVAVVNLEYMFDNYFKLTPQKLVALSGRIKK